MAACNESGVRIALKPVTASMAANQIASPKQPGASFIDTLAQSANGAAQGPSLTQSNSEEQRNDDSGSCGEAQSNDPHSAISQEKMSETTQAPSATPQMTSSAGKSQQASTENHASANAAGSPAQRSVTSQAQAKTTQPDDNQNSSSSQSGADQGSLQLAIAQPFVTPVEIVGQDCADEPALSSGLLSLEISSADSKAFGAIREPLADSNSGGTASAQSFELANSSRAPESPQILAAESTLPFELASTSTFTEGSFLPKGGDASISANKMSQAKIASSICAANAPDGVSAAAADSMKSGSKQEPSPVPHAGQSDGQSSTQAQAASGQLTPAAAKIIDATTQTFGFAAHATSETPSAGHGVSSDTGDVPLHGQAGVELPSDQVDGANRAGSADLNTARLIQSMSQSEMRLGIHSAEFGEISVRTSVSPQQVQAQIEVDHSELGNAISDHIPSLQAKLGNDFGLHASIQVNQLGTSHHTGQQGHPSQQQPNLSSNRVLAGEPVEAADTDTQIPSSLLRSADAGRLDIRV